ncbi:hypothetical protein [Dechloromonas sp. H13]|uniref:hypothetical protein n=1 Tax=Dechloromonas sp. H13 TaxID=2570193 RepID=UPI001291720D|nr:hypothetical protein [Dechloromonas sp. H13]
MEPEEADELQRIVLEAQTRIEAQALDVARELGLQRLVGMIRADMQQIERALRELADRQRAAEARQVGKDSWPF